MRGLAAAVLIVPLAVGACGDDAAPPPPPPIPEALTDFWRTLEMDATVFTHTDGEWLEDYGDAPMYGTAYYARVGAERSDTAMLDLARAARDYDLSVVGQANADRDWFLANMEEAMMSAMGIVEYASATGDEAGLDAVETFLDTANDLVNLFGDYLPSGMDIGSFALETYGPTSITGAVALVNLQYAVNLDTPRRDERIRRAERIVASIDRHAFDGERYLFEPGVDRLYLYPNSIMMIVLCRLHEVTGDRGYLDRTLSVAGAIEPLRSPTRGGFHSPYSAEYMGATTDDYSTLSSQNYLTFAFLLLYERTRDRQWFDEAVGVIDFERLRLYDTAQGRVLHHWMDGRIAQPGDPEYFCSGCNHQTLYMLWYLHRRVGQLPVDPP